MSKIARQLREQSAETAMTGDPARIICDRLRLPASTEAGDWHDRLGHHRYYGSSACNGGERIVESRGGLRGPTVGLRGF